MTPSPEILPPTNGDERLLAAWRYQEQKHDRLVDLWVRYFETPWPERPALLDEIEHARTMIDGAVDDLFEEWRASLRRAVRQTAA